MLGGGNPVGGQNPVGVGSVLNFIGKYAYAYSGAVSVDSTDFNNPDVLLSFTTGSESIAKVNLSFGGEETTDNTVYYVRLNGELVLELAHRETYRNETIAFMSFVLANDTKVEISATNVGNARRNQVMLSGEVIE
jgi:hypothetical protein